MAIRRQARVSDRRFLMALARETVDDRSIHYVYLSTLAKEGDSLVTVDPVPFPRSLQTQDHIYSVSSRRFLLYQGKKARNPVNL